MTDPENQALARVLSIAGTALCVAFLSVVMSTTLPPRLLDPAWELRLIGVLINNGAVALVGFLLILIAPSLHGASEMLRNLRDRVAHLAIAAAIGYLLLIPLQGLALVRGLLNLSQEQANALQRGTTRIEEIRQAVQEARSSSALQSRLQSLRAPLPPLDVSRPIEVVQPQLLAFLNVAQGRLRQRTSGLPAPRLWSLILDSLRVSISAIAFGAAFAAGARWNYSLASSRAYLEEIDRSAPDDLSE